MTDGPRVVVIGSGGREHALAAALLGAPDGSTVIAMPGNDGMARDVTCRAANERDMDELARACEEERADLVVIGPEAPLASGLADLLAERGIAAFGPSGAAARIESSKAFAKEVLRAARVPTADAEAFPSAAAALGALDRWGPPWVVKVDGLAAGKGVCVTRDRAEAAAFLDSVGAGRFGAAGETVLLEGFLDGEELSVMAVCDGTRALLLPAARDYKRALDGDAGPNTGGMGAFAPTPALDPAGERWVLEGIVEPTLAELARRGAAFRGLLYAGLIRSEGGLRVLEFNARFGDPETQVVLPLLEGSLFGLLASAARGALDPTSIRRAPGAALAVALVDERYPDPPRGDAMILGPFEPMPGAFVRFAGVKREGRGFRVTGGRAAYVVAWGETLDVARARAYIAVDRLEGSGFRYRSDIGAVADSKAPTSEAFHGSAA